MKATGIVRRIDDLGRIVIPKEIRRTCVSGRATRWRFLQIKRGNRVEKYSPIGDLSTFAGNMHRDLRRHQEVWSA